MLFDDILEMKSFGFLGFEEIQSLMNNNCTNVLERKGIYFVLRNDEPVAFLVNNVGGHFKDKNPTVDIEKLKHKWVKNTLVVYIGQAGGNKSKETLNKRLKTYMSFGKGDPAAHWGGRFIWQLKNNSQLRICWKSINDSDPEIVEKAMIKDFEVTYGKKPFANIRG